MTKEVALIQTENALGHSGQLIYPWPNVSEKIYNNYILSLPTTQEITVLLLSGLFDLRLMLYYPAQGNSKENNTKQNQKRKLIKINNN